MLQMRTLFLILAAELSIMSSTFASEKPKYVLCSRGEGRRSIGPLRRAEGSEQGENTGCRSPHAVEKAQNREGDPRKAKPFSLLNLGVYRLGFDRLG